MSEKQSAQAPVKLREPGGFEIGGVFGPVPLGTPYTGDVDMTKPLPPSLVAQLDSIREQRAAETPPASAQPVTQARRAPTAAAVAPAVAVDSPRAVVKAAKARVKELRAELKRMKSLQRELAELERLLKAALEKPSAAVRAIRRVG
jgi:hypothetical protein